MCSTTICGTEVLVVPDMREDPRFDHSPMGMADPPCRFYCGMPLITGEGFALGTLCVMDFEPRQLTFEQIESLRRLSHQVLTQLELRRKLIEHNQTLKDLDKARNEVAAEKARAEELLDTILPPSIANSSGTERCSRNIRAPRPFCSRTSKVSPSWPSAQSPQPSLACLTNISRRSMTSSPVVD
jgi:GAF domain-containing protein